MSAKAKIEVKDGVVKQGGKKVGTIGGDGKFYPDSGVSKTAAKAIAKSLKVELGEVTPPPAESATAKNTVTPASEVDEEEEVEEEKEPEAPKAKVVKGDPEPARTERGDLEEDLVRWRHRTWGKKEFAEMYPPARLAAIGIEL